MGAGSRVPFKSLVAFFARFLLIFVVLLLVWSPFANEYGWFFRTTGNILVGQGSYGRVWFERPDHADERHDTQLTIIEPMIAAKTK